jgi:hypothetical protein
MTDKQPILPDRIRRIPDQFSWVDGRLVRDHHIDQCSHPAAALYLFLVTVADARGLSYYGDQSICRRLTMDDSVLATARQDLVRLGLIAYRRPLYQVLDLAPPEFMPAMPGSRRGGPVESIGQLFKRMMEVNG